MAGSLGWLKEVVAAVGSSTFSIPGPSWLKYNATAELNLPLPLPQKC